MFDKKWLETLDIDELEPSERVAIIEQVEAELEFNEGLDNEENGQERGIE